MNITKILLVGAICLTTNVIASELIDFKDLSSEKVQLQVHTRIATLEALNTSLEMDRDRLKSDLKESESERQELLQQKDMLIASLEIAKSQVKVISNDEEILAMVSVLESQKEILTSHIRKLLEIAPHLKIEEEDRTFYRKLGVIKR